MSNSTLIPLLPIRNAVIFPGATMPLAVGRPRSLKALTQARSGDNLIVVVTQRLMTSSDPREKDLYPIGTLCRIDNMVEADGSGSAQLVITGVSRFRVTEFIFDNDYLSVRGETVADVYGTDPVRTRALFNNLKTMAGEILDLLPGAGEPITRLLSRLEDPSYLTNLCSTYLNLPVPQKQALLENTLVDNRLEELLVLMAKEREILQLQHDIQEKMSERLNKAQREALLREQIRTIHEELGDEGSEVQDELMHKIASAKLSPEAAKVADDEMRRLETLPPSSAEYHVIRTYLEWLAGMPWSHSTADHIDIAAARKVLDEDHFGLEPVKKRILQYLAVAKLKNNLHGPILCLIGPPGVGKTSLGQSIARALGRKFIRTSLGGVRDEAEIRGHRRTYIGAMPGRIIQNIKRTGVNNPLFMLDEIDKLGISFQGDPAAAMLEVLDPEQNKSFVDHYLDVAFDLSNVFFVATGNVVDTIPSALRDRMEIIEVSSYTTVEKLEIARRYLIPRLLQDHGLSNQQVSIPDESLFKVIIHYTREAGVRELQREIAALCRSCAEELVLNGRSELITVTPDRVSSMLGPEKFNPEQTERLMRPGVVTGLAWTPHGGDILFIEATEMPGTGRLILTGQLGDVMKESAQIALSIVRTKAAVLLPDFNFEKNDIHIHVPSGAIPKDGPSAGVTMLAALVSLLTKKPVHSKLAMTGEITLRGAVLPVGGIKEKVLAAHRAGIERVLLPLKNKPHVVEIPQDVRSKIKIDYIETVEDVLVAALSIGPLEASVAA